PLNAADCFLALKPREQWPNPEESKPDLIKRMSAEVQKLPGMNYGFSQPIQMRFNELIAGIRSDVGVKIFGDRFEQMLPAANQIAGLLRGVPGAADVKVEQIGGIAMMNIAIDRA